jgi:hypothetical protein
VKVGLKGMLVILVPVVLDISKLKLLNIGVLTLTLLFGMYGLLLLLSGVLLFKPELITLLKSN